jgi:hypothetical protein
MNIIAQTLLLECAMATSAAIAFVLGYGVHRWLAREERRQARETRRYLKIVEAENARLRRPRATVVSIHPKRAAE